MYNVNHTVKEGVNDKVQRLEIGPKSTNLTSINILILKKVRNCTNSSYIYGIFVQLLNYFKVIYGCTSRFSAPFVALDTSQEQCSTSMLSNFPCHQCILS